LHKRIDRPIFPGVSEGDFMLAILLLIALLVIRTAPESLLGKALRRPLVEWPAARLARLTRGRIISLACIGLLIAAGVALIGEEAMRLMAMAMPETLAWLATFDLSVLADAVVAAALLGAQARFGGTATRLRARLARRRPAGPHARAPRRRREAAPKPANDEEPAPAWALTA
jgi:hypothetical protein